jgi:hypothetical protein
LLVAAALCAAPAAAQVEPVAEQPVVERPMTPIPADRLEQMVPKHPGYLGALAPENLKKARPAPPFDLTGTWFIDLSKGFADFMFGPPYPKFGPEGVEALIEAPKAQARNEPYRDAIGQCYPPGMPMLITRVWPHAFVQVPTAIYVISGFNNSVRQIFLDGRQFSDPDLVVPSYNGESIGTWEGDTLVVHTKYFETDNHYVDLGIPISDQFELTERIKLVNGGKTMEVEYTLVDPNMWQGEWKSTKRFNRQDYTDINEATCILQYNQHLPGTNLGKETTDGRGHSEIEEVGGE